MDTNIKINAHTVKYEKPSIPSAITVCKHLESIFYKSLMHVKNSLNETGVSREWLMSALRCSAFIQEEVYRPRPQSQLCSVSEALGYINISDDLI